MLYVCNKQHMYVHKRFSVVLLIYVCNMKTYMYTPVAACWIVDLVKDTGTSVRVPVRCSLQWAMQRNAKKNVIQNQFVVVYNTSGQCS